MLTSSRVLRLALPVMLSPVALTAQPASRPINLGEARVISSVIMGENRELQISLPASYGRTAIAYPVLFMLDGSSHLLHATATVRFLAAARERIPEMIVVAIPNTNRNRDLTPGRGAATFQRFIREELIPWVERTYRAAPERVLMGHSLGGSFTVHAMLNNPELFDAYIAASAPLWRYDSLAYQARPGLARSADAGVALYLTVGELERENPRLLAGVQRFGALVDSVAPRAPTKWFALLTGEDHSSTAQRTLYAALEARYAGWTFPFFEDTTQLAAAGGLAQLEKHYGGLSTRFGFSAPPPESRLGQVARIYVSADRLDDALALAEKYTRPYPAMAEQVVNQIGYERLRRGQGAAAVETFRRGVTLFPESPNAHDSLAEALCRTGQRDLARTSFEQAVTVAKATSSSRLAAVTARALAGCPS